jgi:Ca2+-binding RTX toxin-like protein
MLIGNSGNDTLEGGKNVDRLEGGEGDDIYIIDNEEDEIIDTQGTNTVQSSQTISIKSYSAIQNLELIGNAVIDGTGNDKNNFIDGNEENNKLDGGVGDDELDAKGGDDTLIGGSGNNILRGGNGDDVAVYVGSKNDYSHEFVDGTYTVININSSETDLLYDIETIKFSDGEFPIVDEAGTLQLSVADVNVKEGGTADVVLKLDGEPTEAFSVKVTTVDNSAKTKSDYTAYYQNVTFKPGQTSVTVKIKTTQDKTVEETENFSVEISNPSADNIEFTNTSATITIQDDDKPTLSIAAAKIKEGQAGKSAVDVVVTLSSISTQTVKVHYETVDGTAKRSTDYTAQVGDLEIKAGSKTGKISIPIVNDKISESQENFMVKLSSPQGAILGTKASASVTITDDDATSSGSTASSAAMEIELVGVTGLNAGGIL